MDTIDRGSIQPNAERDLNKECLKTDKPILKKNENKEEYEDNHHCHHETVLKHMY